MSSTAMGSIGKWLIEKESLEHDEAQAISTRRRSPPGRIARFFRTPVRPVGEKLIGSLLPLGGELQRLKWRSSSTVFRKTASSCGRYGCRRAPPVWADPSGRCCRGNDSRVGRTETHDDREVVVCAPLGPNNLISEADLEQTPAHDSSTAIGLHEIRQSGPAVRRGKESFRSIALRLVEGLRFASLGASLRPYARAR